MAIYKNVAGQKLAVMAYNTTDGSFVTSDAANITGSISLDGSTSSATSDVNPTEVAGLEGVYVFDLSQAETNTDLILLSAESTTANVQLDPVQVLTTDPLTSQDVWEYDASSAAAGSTGARLYDISPFLTTLETDIDSNFSKLVVIESDVSSIKSTVDATAHTPDEVYAEFTSGNNADAFKADVSALATASSITTLSGDVGDIDTKVDSLDLGITNLQTDLTAVLADTNELQTNQGDWATATGFSTFNPSTDTVANVTTVQTTVSNTDMRGTDGANTVAPDNASITAILADTNELQLNQNNWLTATGFSTFDPATDTVARVTLVDTTTDLTNQNAGGTTPAAVYTYFTDLSREDAFKADVSSLATQASVDSVDTDIQNIGSDVSAILTDTNDLQTNQGQWLTATGFSTHSPADVYAEFTSGTNEDVFKADVSSLATSAEIAGLNDLSSSDVATAVWDASITSHNIMATFGRFVREVKEGTVSAASSINDASATTTSFVTNLLQTTDGFYHDKVMVFIDGSLAGQARHIEDYNGTTKAITVSQPFTSAPANGTDFLILATHEHSLDEIATAAYNHFTSGTNEDAFKADVSSLAQQSTLTLVHSDVNSNGAAITTLSGDVSTIDSKIDDIDAQTSQMQFSVPGLIDANVSIADDLSVQLAGPRKELSDITVIQGSQTGVLDNTYYRDGQYLQIDDNGAGQMQASFKFETGSGENVGTAISMFGRLSSLDDRLSVRAWDWVNQQLVTIYFIDGSVNNNDYNRLFTIPLNDRFTCKVETTDSQGILSPPGTIEFRVVNSGVLTSSVLYIDQMYLNYTAFTEAAEDIYDYFTTSGREDAFKSDGTIDPYQFPSGRHTKPETLDAVIGTAVGTLENVEVRDGTFIRLEDDAGIMNITFSGNTSDNWDPNGPDTPAFKYASSLNMYARFFSDNDTFNIQVWNWVDQQFETAQIIEGSPLNDPDYNRTYIIQLNKDHTQDDLNLDIADGNGDLQPAGSYQFRIQGTGMTSARVFLYEMSLSTFVANTGESAANEVFSYDLASYPSGGFQSQYEFGNIAKTDFDRLLSVKQTTDVLATLVELDGSDFRYTAKALELAPTGSGVTSADIYTYFTSNGREDAFKVSPQDIWDFDITTSVIVGSAGRTLDGIPPYLSQLETDIDANYSLLVQILEDTEDMGPLVDDIRAEVNDLYLNQNNWLTATGFATSAELSTVSTNLTDVKAVTEKLDTTMILDGAVYQFTVNALENAPSGGGDSAADIYTYFTTGTRPDPFKADISVVATDVTQVLANQTIINDGVKKASLFIPHTQNL